MSPVFFFVALIGGVVAGTEINMTEYFRMPSLNLFHDYDRCMQIPEVKHEPNVYCFVQTTIKPNASNPLWTYIESFSADEKHHFRHDRIQRGLCLKTCKQALKKYDYWTQMKYYQERFETHSEVQMEPNTYEKALDYRIRYNMVVNKCVNLELLREYQLKGYSTVEFCTSSRDRRDFDTVDVTFITLVVCLLLLVVGATCFDVFLEKRDLQAAADAPPHHNHYQQKLDKVSTMHRVLLAFSLPRNWFQLITPPDSTVQKDLRFIEAIRFLTMYGVLVAHSLLLSQVMPIQNPDYVERKYTEVATVLLLNGFKVIQTFFTISGFLQAVQFYSFVEKEKQFRVGLLWKSIAYRYCRLMPVYGFMMLLDASMLVHIHDGPFWPRVAETQRYFCRNNWWANVLFINNYVTTDEPCLQQSWYLAVDFQLFIIGLGMLLITWRYPQSLRYVFAVAFSVAWLVPAIVAYHNRFEGVVIISPEESKNLHWYDKGYKMMYIPTHCNMGSFFAGLLGGYIYKKVLTLDTFTMKRTKGMIVAWYGVVPAGLGIVMSGYIFYAYDFKTPSVLMSIYASASVNLWGVLVIVLFLGLTMGVGKIIRSILNCPIFVPLGRLTYCTFLCHCLVLRTTTGDMREPVYLSDNFFLTIVMSTLILSYIISVVLCLCIEMPATNLQKLYVATNKTKETGDNVELEMK